MLYNLHVIKKEGNSPKELIMKISLFETDGKKYYEANVWKGNEHCIYLEFYTTKNEAIKAVKDYKKSYKGNIKLDCFVTLFDENGFSIESYNI